MILLIIALALTLLVLTRWKPAALEHYRASQTPDFFKLQRDLTLEQNGIAYLRSRRLIICGLVRDSAINLPKMINQVEQVTNLVSDYRVLIVENDSADRTRQILLAWSGRDTKVQVLGCGGINLSQCRLNLPSSGRDIGTARIDKMVHLRNIYLNHIRQTVPTGWAHLCAVWDLDGEGVLYRDGLLNSAGHLARDETVDAIASQGYRVVELPRGSVLKYGDSYAFADQFTQNLGLTKAEKGAFLGMFSGYPYGFKQVISAFNGFCLYRASALLKHNYSSGIDKQGETVCEHTGLHYNMKVWVNPNMIYAMLQYD